MAKSYEQQMQELKERIALRGAIIKEALVKANAFDGDVKEAWEATFTKRSIAKNKPLTFKEVFNKESIAIGDKASVVELVKRGYTESNIIEWARVLTRSFKMTGVDMAVRMKDSSIVVERQ